MSERKLPMDLSGTSPSEQKKSMRNWWIKTILLLALVVLSIFMLFTLGNYLSGETPQLKLIQLIQTVNRPLFLLLLGIIVLYILVESSKYSYMLKVYTGKFRFRTAVKTMFLGKYYDGITPLSTGGQPFQIYYLHKKKEIPSGAATAIPIVRYLVSVILLSVVSIVMLSIAPKYLPNTAINVTAIVVSWVSLAINIIFPITIAIFSIFPGTKRVLAGIIRLLWRLRIVKRRYSATKRLLRELNEYSSSLKQVWKQFYKFIPLFFLCLLEIALFLTIPFFVVISIGNVEPTVPLMIQIACLVVITRYTALLIPTPGNTGAAEAAGSLVFVTVTGIGSVIGWVLLVWRFFTYYMYILSGIGINIFEIIRSAVRNRKSKSNVK